MGLPSLSQMSYPCDWETISSGKWTSRASHLVTIEYLGTVYKDIPFPVSSNTDSCTRMPQIVTVWIGL
jgi:hypothetical protein